MLTAPFLLPGGIIQGIMFPANLGRFGNSIAIWLAIEPYELFFYIFLPPLLFDAAVRIDFFLFKKVRAVLCSVRHEARARMVAPLRLQAASGHA